MSAPSIDVVIAIHDPSRPLDRALDSVFEDAPTEVGALVVCHGIAPDTVATKVPFGARERVRIISYVDGVRSPAGPFNAGIDASRADYVSVMGSDDFLEPGAMRAWQQIATDRGSDAVIAEQRHQSGEFIASPLVRAGRSHDLDAVRDRLYYRTAPLGLLRRQYLIDQRLRFTEGAGTGEDVVMSTLIWSHGRVDLARGCPRYVIGADAPDRTSHRPRPLSDIAEGILALLDYPEIAALPTSQRRSLAIRVTRTSVMNGIRERTLETDWDDAQVDAVRIVMTRLSAFAPGFLAPLSRADRRMLAEAVRTPASASASATRRDQASRLSDLVPRNPLRLLARESTATRYLLYRLDRGRSTVGGKGGAHA